MRKIYVVAVASLFTIGGAHIASAQKCGEAYEVAVGTTQEQIARILVNQMFNDIMLTDKQNADALAVVVKMLTDANKLDRKSPDFMKDRKALQATMRTDLTSLLTKDDDKAKLAACFKLMDKPRGGGE